MILQNLQLPIYSPLFANVIISFISGVINNLLIDNFLDRLFLLVYFIFYNFLGNPMCTDVIGYINSTIF